MRIVHRTDMILIFKINELMLFVIIGGINSNSIKIQVEKKN
jgi:hypothetical protein